MPIPSGLSLTPWRDDIISAYTGPKGGLTQLDMHKEDFPSCDDPPIAGVDNWNNPTEFAYGISLSLYEEDRSRDRMYLLGEPIADVFAVLVRGNNTIIALADGASWGKKPRLAARCAVNSAINHIVQNTSRVNTRPNSKTVSSLLEESLDAAQKCIITHRGTLTTLSIGIVCQLQKSKFGPNQWGLFVASVGDSPIFVYSPMTQMVYEATEGSHPKNGMRAMNLSGGMLGPAVGTSPDLENLCFAYLPVYEGDIVFATSDGVSDNFYPEVLNPGITLTQSSPPSIYSDTIPCDQCRLNNKDSHSHKCCENVTEIAKLLKKHQTLIGEHISAQTVSASLINFIAELTNSKRTFFAKCIEEKIDIKKKSKEDPQFAKEVKMLPGKLDHATVVAYTVGIHANT
jgi:serine/threonine protein phosphatase PrpC